MELDILRISPVGANNVSGGRDGDICSGYGGLFSGVGLLKGYKLKLHIDNSVKPVAEPLRRIPFGLREMVDKKLDELLKLDVSEEVSEGP